MLSYTHSNHINIIYNYAEGDCGARPSVSSSFFRLNIQNFFFIIPFLSNIARNVCFSALFFL